MYDAQMEDHLRLVNEFFPPIDTMTAQEARQIFADRVQPVDNIDVVASADDLLIDRDGDPLRVRVYQPHGPRRARPAVVYAHGGGYVACSIESHDGFCREMSAECDAVVISVDYRLAPEHKAPAALEDMIVAFTWVVENASDLGADPRLVAVGGDSAGGGLAATTSIALATRSLPTPCSQILNYPMLDPSCGGESYRTYGQGYGLTRAHMEWFWRQCLPEEPLSPELRSLVAPLGTTDLTGQPPAVVVIGRLDPLSSDGEEYAAQLTKAGVPVLTRLYPELYHGFMTVDVLPAAAAARRTLWRDVATLFDLAAKETPA